MRLRPQLLALLVFPAALCAQEQPAYPLDPLSRQEIVGTMATLTMNQKLHPASRIETITLHEPAKDDVLAWTGAGPVAPRTASVMLYDWSTGVTSTGIVDPHRHQILSWTDQPPADPLIFGIAIARATEVARGDSHFRAAMARRGYTDLSRIRVEPSVSPPYRLPMRDGDRTAVAGVFDRDALDMGRSRGLFDVTVWEDLTRGTVDSLRDDGTGSTATHTAGPASTRVGTPDPEARTPAIATRRIMIHGTAVRWGRWRLRVGVDPRRGLELYNVGFADGGRVRPILYRASLSEMIAPYGDPAFISWFPMDEGDVGLGAYGMTSMVPGEDAPAGAAFLSAVFADDRGKAVELPRAAAVFEREGDVQWRHGNGARRARELVVRGVCTADNYDYVFDWVFREDGSIRVQVAPTGIINAYAMDTVRDSSTMPTMDAISRHRVGTQTVGPIHQHFFSYRLDFDIDRPDHNRVVEMRPRALPLGADNPDGEWFGVRARPIRTEQDALDDSGAMSPRWWMVISTRDTNALGQPTGYALIPGENIRPYPSPQSAPRRRAPFVAHELWVTPYHPDEMYAAGEVPSGDTSAQGLARWTAANRPVEDGDVVLWYTLGMTHLPRTEDWPVMPTYPIGFRLVPAGFFSHDPALDSTVVSGP
jgi:primary-amine oxidase